MDLRWDTPAEVFEYLIYKLLSIITHSGTCRKFSLWKFMNNKQPANPLHYITLEKILIKLVDDYAWAELPVSTISGVLIMSPLSWRARSFWGKRRGQEPELKRCFWANEKPQSDDLEFRFLINEGEVFQKSLNACAKLCSPRTCISTADYEPIVFTRAVLCVPSWKARMHWQCLVSSH